MSQFRSGLEEQVGYHLGINKKGTEYLYEPFRLPYVTHRQYVPDFVHEGKRVLIECKGFFRAGDTQKYKAIRDSMPTWELVFIVTSKKKKVRKNSKVTMGEWCDKEGFLCYTAHETKDLVKYIKGKKT
jgi:hypothetical protein|tara:strand:- start:1514 stop:1897 length:384 start_codon:yes stop_codon:yes gene_type:complete